MGTPVRTLHIHQESRFSNQRYTVFDSDNRTPLYSVAYTKIPHIGIFAASSAITSLDPHRRKKPANQPSLDPSGNPPDPNPTSIATIKFHHFQSQIDLSIHGTPLNMYNPHLRRIWTFPSSTLGVLEWKIRGGWGLKVSCVDSKGQVVARWHSELIDWRRVGFLEIMAGVEGEANREGRSRVLDELVTGMFAMVELQRRRSNAPSAAAGGGSLAAASCS